MAQSSRETARARRSRSSASDVSSRAASVVLNEDVTRTLLIELPPILWSRCFSGVGIEITTGHPHAEARTDSSTQINRLIWGSFQPPPDLTTDKDSFSRNIVER